MKKKTYTLKELKAGTLVAGDTKEKLRKQLMQTYPKYTPKILKTVEKADYNLGFAGKYLVKLKLKRVV